MDFDSDGKLDILSGSYWTSGEKAGHIQMLSGRGGLDFAAAVAVTNSAGKPLENAEILEAAGSNLADNQTQTICTHQHAVDYDGDGDFDIVNGCFGPEFFLYMNSGSNQNLQFAEKPIVLPVKSRAHHAAPHLADWDDDGDLDLLSGTSEGGVIISINEGTRAEPVWSEFRQLVPGSDKMQQSTADGKEIVPSPSTRVWTYDWNSDGYLDLLVGDCANIVNPKDGVSPEEYERLTKKNAEDMERVQADYQALYEKFQSSAESGEASEEMQKQLTEASSKMMEVYSARKEFEDSQSTGFVWLYLRVPPRTYTLNAGNIEQ